jgi:hypothetical protein
VSAWVNFRRILKAIATQKYSPLQEVVATYNNLLSHGWGYFLTKDNFLKVDIASGQPKPATKKKKTKPQKPDLLYHRWQDSAINQAARDIVVNGVTVPKGYINATQMCQANGKLWNDYKRLKKTTEYWQGLEGDMGIPISGLILDIPGSGDEQSTWVHPEVAMDLGQWVSTPFRIWVNPAIARFMVHQQQSIGISAQYQLVAEFMRQTAR